MKLYTYVIVLKTLSPIQQVVQACHAVQGLPGGLETAMVICTARNVDELVLLHRNLSPACDANHLFYEPPLQQYTAAAFIVSNAQQRSLFRRLKLLQKV